MRQEIQPWRVSPFSVGRSYRGRRDFTSLRDSFATGEVLTFESDVYNHYHGCTGYFFSQAEANSKRVWDIHDADDLNIWRELFEEVV